MSNSAKRAYNWKYKLSFVMPVYNASEYLAATLESVVTQSMKFADNIQLVLVNDGSSDDSESICLHYQAKYPENVIYIKQENAGVSAARNRGVEEVEGKYISFLDSDDLVSPDTVQKVYNFFEEHYDEIDIVAVKLVFFEAQTGDHPLNYKFHTTRIIDIEQEPNSILLSGGSAFVKTETIKNIHKFDERLAVSEDSKLLTEIILEKGKYGVLSEPTYFYRKRAARNSAISGAYKNKSWYINTPKYAYLYLLDLSEKLHGRPLKYIQHLVMYDLQWRFKQSGSTVLTQYEQEKYKSLLYKLLQYIDDDVVIAQRSIFIEHKVFILGKKYGINPYSKSKRRDSRVMLGETCIYDYDTHSQSLRIELFDVSNNTVTIEGRVFGLIFPGAKFGFSVGGVFHQIDLVDRKNIKTYFLDELVHGGNGFRVEFNITNSENVVACLVLGDGKRRLIAMSSGRVARINLSQKYPYKIIDGYLVCASSPSRLEFVPYKKVTHVKKELKYLGGLQIRHIKHNLKLVRDALKLSMSGVNSYGKIRSISLFNSIILYRLLYYGSKLFIKNRVWLVTDRQDAAGDNGEALFYYLSKQPHKNIKKYFAISSTSADYNRLNSEKNIIDRAGWRYKVLFLHAEKIISSQADDPVINPYGYRWNAISDLYQFDFVFLQHGIIKDDLSNWLDRHAKNIKLFVTSSALEYSSIVNGNYGYAANQVKLTGLPRYDLLESNPSKKIILAPTWRLGLTSISDEAFLESDFYRFYNSFMNDPGLVEVLKKTGYNIEFCIHPNHAEKAHLFKSNSRVKIKEYPYEYREVFREGALLVTDYSSVAFDFAYLRKPVVYAQFDKLNFYAGQVYDEGYFSYEEHGFGPVVYDLKSAIDQVIRFVQDDCNMSKKYQHRLDEFFGWNDRRNSQRVYQAILSMDEVKNVANSVMPIAKTKWKRHRASIAVDVWWWRYDYPLQLNFGDEVTPYMLYALYGIKSEWTEIKNARLIGAGSVLGMLHDRTTPDDASKVVWGAGYMQEGPVSDRKDITYFAVRGPRTADRLPTMKNKTFGDPGILANRVFERSSELAYKVGFVYNYIDSEHQLLKMIEKLPGYLVIDPLQTPDKVAIDITSCEYIFSSSLHGLIFADSYGIPNSWVELSDLVVGGGYKFDDYYQSTGRRAKKVPPEAVLDEEKMEDLKRKYEPIKNLEEMQDKLIDSLKGYIDEITQP